MVIEEFITWYLRKKNNQYLQFKADQKIEIPFNQKEGQYLLYLHIPFCERLCPYCSFNRYPFEETLAREYFTALRQEMTMYKEKGYNFSGAYIGGGTPTILIDELAETIKKMRTLFSLQDISVETNPNHLTEEKIALLKDLGINRLSVGVQSFNDTILRSVERLEKYGCGQEIQQKLLLAQGNFNTLNVDMIFNFPHQTMEMLEEDLDILLRFKVDQVTFYPLMVSSLTQKEMSNKLGKIDYRKEKAFYFKILERLKSDFHPATAWCFSRQEGLIDEYIVQYDEYAGVGSGAFGYMNGCIYANTFSLKEYIEKIGLGHMPLMAQKHFSQKEQIRYDFLMKLFGGSLKTKEISAKFNGRFLGSLWLERLFFSLLGGITQKEDTLYLTQKGLYYWVIMMREFFIGVNNFRDHCRKLIKEP